MDAVVEIPPLDDDDAAADRQQVRLYTHKPPSSYTHAMVALLDEPNTLEQARRSPDAAEWEQAVAEELRSMQEHQVFDVCDLPPGHKTIKSRFVFKRKLGPDGTVVRYKARLVAKGFTQVPGVDFDDTFAPVARMTSIRALLALAHTEDYAVHQVDVKTAFLYGDLDEELYLEPPKGCVPQDQEGKVWRLKKSLYGLRQSPRQWNLKLDSFLRTIGFAPCPSEHSVYVSGARGQQHVLLSVYVDDMIIIGQLDDVIKTKRRIAEQFDIADLGGVHWLLGVEIQRLKDGFSMSQKSYIESTLKTLNLADCKPLSTPAEPGFQLVRHTPDSSDQLLDAAVPYRSAVGSLMYLVTCTRPDIANAVSTVSKFLEQPTTAHWTAVKRIFRYLKGTIDHKLHLSARNATTSTCFQLSGFCDADYGGDLDTRRSTTGYCFSLGSGSISWSSKRQPTVALSTTEAEYMAFSDAAREVLWLRQLLADIGYPQSDATMVYSDNQGCIALARNPVFHARVKHIDIRHHFVRERLTDGTLDLQYQPTETMIADILTKPLPRPKFVVHVADLGLWE